MIVIFTKNSSKLLRLLALLSCSFTIAAGYSVRNVELPTPRVVVIPADSSDPSRDEVVLHKPHNSQLVAGDGEEISLNSRIKLECDAAYPIQFIYTGDGMPEYTTNTSQSENPGQQNREPGLTKPKTLFEAHLFLGYGRPLAYYDTGKYTCRSLQDPTKAAHYYLFVSDGKLFIRPDGEMLYFKRTDPSVRIPCSVTHPKAVVSLQKVVNGLVQCPLNDSISFEPTSGFQIKTGQQRFDPAGTYVCTAGRNGVYQAIQYELVPETPSSDVPPPEPIQKQPCRRDVDCPNNEACLNNGHCGSPCANSCGQNTSCRVVNHLANCQCLSGYRGDPYVGCSMSSTTSSPPQHSEPCHPYPCGTNTRCDNHNGIAKCSCAPGFQGDPYYRCYRRHNDPCNPNPCGPHSVCMNRNNYASCSCSQGFIGTPPHCRAECEVDHHCSYSQVCYKYQCKNPCEGACNDIPNTQCRVINRRPVCARYQNRCPPGYYGRDCSHIYERETDKAPPPKQEDNDNILEENSVSPCVPFPCGANAECVTRTVTNLALNTTSEVALCSCPPKTTGNADMECYPVEEQLTILNKIAITHEDVRHDLEVQDEELQEVTTSASDSPTPTTVAATTSTPASTSTEASKATKKCGTNAIAIVAADGKSICSCPMGYTGLASIECHAMTMDDEPDQLSNSSSTVDIVVDPEYCDGVNTTISCGHNAYCVINNGSETCMCMPPFKGSPDVGCELECSSDADCPIEYTCYLASGKCVDPCEPGLQMFFKSCGRDAYCKVEDHKPVCYCPRDLPHGNPEIHCKEKAWMPNHLPPSPLPTCEEKSKENCGNNTECRMFHDSKTYCVCTPGFFGDPYDTKGSGCEQGLECRNSTHCASAKECVNGRCLDPCRPHKIQCGEHAGCSAGENHKPRCICNIGTIRNSDGSCEPVRGALAERMAFFRSFEDF